MAETFGSLCDKLTIIKLKQFHTHDAERKASLTGQEQSLRGELDRYLAAALSGAIPADQLEFPANKVFNPGIGALRDFSGGFGEVFSALAAINCDLWHEQEKVYDFQQIPPEEKDAVVARLAVLNLERNRCIDGLNRLLAKGLRRP